MNKEDTISLLEEWRLRLVKSLSWLEDEPESVDSVCVIQSTKAEIAILKSAIEHLS